jgi:hypothetical protein
MSADRLTLFSPLAIWSSPESALRFRDFDTSDGEMKRLSAKFLDGTCGSFWMASFRRSATSWPCMVVAQITNLEIGNLFIWQPTNAGGAPQEKLNNWAALTFKGAYPLSIPRFLSVLGVLLITSLAKDSHKRFAPRDSNPGRIPSFRHSWLPPSPYPN